LRKLKLRLPTTIYQRPGSYTIHNEDFIITPEYIKRESLSRNVRRYAYYAILRISSLPDSVKLLLKNEKASFLVKSDSIFGDYLKVKIERKLNPRYKPAVESKWYTQDFMEYN